MKFLNLLGLIFLNFFWLVSLPAQEDDFYQLDAIQDISIEFKEENWQMALDSLRYNGDELLEASLTINGTTLDGVGVRIKKSRFFEPDQQKNSLFVRLDYKKEGQTYQGNRAVLLSESLRDPSMVREVLAYEMARKYMPAPRANFAKVEVNEEYYGLFVNVEPIDSSFLQHSFGESQGHLFYSDPLTEALEGDYCLDAAFGNLLSEPDPECYRRNFQLVRGKSYEPLVQLVAALNSDQTALRNEILDIDNTLWMLAYNNVIANLSSYLGKEAPNYFLYQQADGRFAPIMWNTNFAFGSVKNIGKGSDLSVDQMEKLDILLHQNERTKPLVSQLLADEYNRKRYLSHLRTILYEEFLSGEFELKAKALQELIKESLIADKNHYYNAVDFDKSLVATIGNLTRIPGLLTFMNNRARYLKKAEPLLYVPAEIGEPVVKQRKRYSRDRIEKFQIQVPVSEFTSSVTIHYRFDEDQPYQSMQMEDDGNHYDEAAGDNIYGVIIPPAADADTIHFYLVAENAKTIAYAPTRYTHEQFRFSLTELNK
ncbi:MAG TPA: CotH kinase family protein [Saprospiraceae bacterium]|nr:CotH kinase family protein [Saprospiraceae bacterium]